VKMVVHGGTPKQSKIRHHFSIENHGFRDAQSFQEPPYVIHDLAENFQPSGTILLLYTFPPDHGAMAVAVSSDHVHVDVRRMT